MKAWLRGASPLRCGGGAVCNVVEVVVVLVLLSGRVIGALGQTETSNWLHRAAALQRYLGYDVPLDKQTSIATHNSFSSDRDLRTHSNFEVVTAQIYGLTDQLNCLGVRGLELDVHYIQVLEEEGDEESALRLCHTSADAASQLQEICETFGWADCEAAGVPDLGNDTGCRADAPTLREGFEEIANWLELEENLSEVVFIKLDGSLDDEDERVSTVAADVFGLEMIFLPATWEADSESEAWPSPAELVDAGTRVVLAGLEPSTLVFSTVADLQEEIVAADDFSADDCDEIDGNPEPSWIRVQGDMVVYELYSGNSTIFAYTPSDDDALTASATPSVMSCGLTPTFDRLDAELMESTVWSWAVDRPEAGFALPRTAVVSAVDGRWTDTGSDSEEGERHSFACRDSESRFSWTVVAVPVEASRRRRKLTTSDADADDDDDGNDNDDDDVDDEEIVESEWDGKFHEADEACQALGDGYVFGAPRTAYENQQLVLAMQGAGVETVWVDHISPGDIDGWSMCWTREGGQEYCVDTSDDVCSGSPAEVEETADGQLPFPFPIAEWEVDNYTRPSYSVTRTVENLHGWVRVKGENEFDLEDKGYVDGIVLAAVPVFIFGFIVACCCLPVGHIAAGSQEHHMNGRGFFGSFCPTRCKQGDFLGSGTLVVVMLGVALTVIGGAAAIYGVRAVDADIVNLWNNLQGMGEDMVSAQSSMDAIFDSMTSVEESFPAVASCSGLTSLEGVVSAISGAKDELKDLADEGNIGSVGLGIQDVNDEIESTATMRRAVVYVSGSFVLVMSLIYVAVGYYALKKDGGRGKGGGARMRGPVVIGCVFLPITLVVIMACWFIFGLSVSVALLTSDFCVEPVGHTMEIFSDPADQIVAAYYMSCEGSNVFVESLSTAFLQGKAASILLASSDEAQFEATCPDQVSAREDLQEDISEILDEIQAIGKLVRCSNVNPYFVKGVEESLCSDAPSKIWYVICGFAVVSVSLFVVAVSFRLLLQQKEEGLYRVVFEEDMSESGASSVLSDDGFPAAKGGNGNGGNGSGDGGCFDAGSHEQDDAVVAVAAVCVPSRGHAENDDGDGGAASKAAQSGTGTASAHLSSSTGSRTESSTLYSVSPGAPGESEVGWDDTAMPKMGRARPVESLLPVPRSSSASGRHQLRAASTNPFAATDDDPMSRSTSLKYSSRIAATLPKKSSSSRSISSKRWGSVRGSRNDGGARRAPVSAAPFSLSSDEEKAAQARALSRAEGSARAGGSGRTVDLSRQQRLRRARSSSDRRGSDRGGEDGVSVVGEANVDTSRRSEKLKPSKLFRTLAGLDDPTEGAPSVIVSRYGANRSTRNLGGVSGVGVDDPEHSGRFTFTVAREASHVGGRHSSRAEGNSRARDSSDVDMEDDMDERQQREEKEASAGWMGGDGGVGGAGARASRGRAKNRGRLSEVEGADGSGRSYISDPIESGGSRRNFGGGRPWSSSRNMFASSQGTWGAFTRELSRRDPEVGSVSGSGVFRSRRNGGSEGEGRSEGGSGKIRWSGRGDHHRLSRGAVVADGGAGGVSSSDRVGAAGGRGEEGGSAGVTGGRVWPESPESSTVSGLSGWRRQRSQLRAVSHMSSRLAAADGANARGRGAARPGMGAEIGAGEVGRSPRRKDPSRPGGPDGRQQQGGEGSEELRTDQARRRGRLSRRETRGGNAPAAASSSSRSPGSGGYAVVTGMAAGSASSRPDTTSGIRGLDALAYPSPAAVSGTRSKRQEAGGVGTVGAETQRGSNGRRMPSPRNSSRSAPISPRSSSSRPVGSSGTLSASAHTAVPAVTGTRVASGAGQAAVHSRPGTRMSDILKARKGEGRGGLGGGGGRRAVLPRPPSVSPSPGLSPVAPPYSERF